jgi:nitrate/nitrite-specific signal transduction histidine kinase
MTSEDKSGKGILKRGEEFLSLYQKVEEFTREILHENERLRFRVASLDQENSDLKSRAGMANPEGLVDSIRRLEREKEELLHRYAAVEKENIDFAKRYVEIEEENNNLANLYVASFQLHSTLDFKEVLQIVKEIIVNLVGADQFIVFLADAKKEELTAVASEGFDQENLPVIRPGQGVVGGCLQEEQGVHVAQEGRQGTSDVFNPLVSIPLKIQNDLIGDIAIYNLLEQKKEFTPLDIELFNLLGGHAATAIFGAKLYTESKRKLSTIQGFLELLKPE